MWGASPTSLTIGGTSSIGLSSALALNGGIYTINDPKGLANFSGLISGAGSLNLTGKPTFSGPITGGPLPAAGSSVVLSGAVSGGSYSPVTGAAISLSGTYSGPLSNLAPSGGTLVIADNTSSGTLSVYNGTFLATSSTSFGPATLVLNGGTLGATTALTGSNAITNPLTWGTLLNPPQMNVGGSAKFTLSGSLDLGSTPLVTYTINDPAGLSTLSGAITDQGNLTFIGSPTLAGVNSYSSGTFFSPNSFPSITNNLAFGTSTLSFSNGGFQATTPLTGANAIANPWVISSGSAAYFFGTNAIQLSAAATLTGSQSIHITNPALTVNLSGLLSGGGTLILATETATSGNGALVVNNPNNTFTGGFTLQSNGGNVDVQGASTTGPAGAVTSGPLGTGPVTLNSANTTFSNLWNSSVTAVTLGNNLNIYDAAGFSSASGLNFTGTTTLTGPDNAGMTQLFVAANSNVTFAGVISGGTKGINLRAPAVS